MPRFVYTPTITLGGILQIITILGGIFGAYVAVAQREVQHDERINAQQKDTTRLEKRVEETSAHLHEELAGMNNNIMLLNEKISTYIIGDLRNQIRNKELTNDKLRSK